MFKNRRRFIHRSTQKNSIPLIKRYKKVFLLFFGVIILIFLIKFINESLKVKNIKINVDKLTCVENDEITQRIKSQIKNTFFINSTQLEKDIKKKYYCVVLVNIKRSGLNKLEVEIKQRVPIAKVIKTESQNLDSLIAVAEATASSEAANLKYPDFSVTEASAGTSFAMDSQGMLFAKNIDDQNLQIIYDATDELTLGKVILEGKALEIIKLIERIKQIPMDINTVKVEGDKLLIDTKPKLVFGLDRNLNTQFASLQLILLKAKMNSGEISATSPKSKQIEIINLRFDKPVVRYSK